MVDADCGGGDGEGVNAGGGGGCRDGGGSDAADSGDDGSFEMGLLVTAVSEPSAAGADGDAIDDMAAVEAALL